VGLQFLSSGFVSFGGWRLLDDLLKIPIPKFVMVMPMLRYRLSFC